MNVRGRILEIGDTQKISDRFQKREFVIEYAENPQYPEYVQFEVIQDKCSMLDTCKVGDDVDVYFNLKGRKWTNPQGQVKYFNSLQAWKLETAGQGSGQTPPPMDSGDLNNMEEPGWISEDEQDLPF
jgi:hypothetical protein